jgi:hypothetical protein
MAAELTLDVRPRILVDIAPRTSGLEYVVHVDSHANGRNRAQDLQRYARPDWIGVVGEKAGPFLLRYIAGGIGYSTSIDGIRAV